MRRRLIIRAEAESDITEAAAWYEARESGLGLQLVDEIGEAIQRASGNPLLFLRVRKRPRVHRILARRFPYRIYYIVREEAVTLKTAVARGRSS